MLVKIGKHMFFPILNKGIVYPKFFVLVELNKSRDLIT